jgi:quinol monooxygenase YgiN
MKDRIIIIATLKLIDNRISQLKEVVEELQAHSSKTEAGMLQYDWYVSDNSDTIKVLETYTNSDAVLFHFDNHKPFSARLSQSRTFVTMELFGNASEALKQRVKKINAQHFTAITCMNKLN